jgi:hypothetical protein
MPPLQPNFAKELFCPSHTTGRPPAGENGVSLNHRKERVHIRSLTTNHKYTIFGKNSIELPSNKTAIPWPAFYIFSPHRFIFTNSFSMFE